MKQIYLVHCWDGSSDDGWYPWIEKQLKKYGVAVIRFDMPNTTSPAIEQWTNTLDQQVRKLNQDTFFIGHSIGCQTIMRYLEQKDVTPIGGILFVAPWLELLPKAIEDDESFHIAYPWIHTPINFEKVKQFTNNIYCIFSDDDYFVSLDQEKEFRKKLNSKTCIVREKGHISQDDGIFELEEILNYSEKMLGVKK